MNSHVVSQNASGRARLLFVHAHPDDETLATGVSMAAYAAGGHDVYLLTCTLGEEGEIIPPALAHLGADRDDTLGPWRREELRSAMSVMGVAHSVLGEDSASGVGSRYRDSGMAGTPSAAHPDAFARADPLEAATLVAAHIKALRPDVVVTYDEHGGYAHPDHIQTHRVTMAALAALATEAEAEAEAARLVVPMAFCILTPLSWATQDRVWLHQNVAATNPNCVVLQPDAPYAPSVVNDSVVTHFVEEPAMVDMQSRALSRHATQVRVYDGYYSLSNRVAGRLGGREGFAQFDPIGGELLPVAQDAVRHSGLLADSRVRR